MGITEAHQGQGLGPPGGAEREGGRASVITVHLCWALARRTRERVGKKGSSGAQQSCGNVTLFLWHQEPCSGQEVKVCIPPRSSHAASSSKLVRPSVQGKPAAPHSPIKREAEVLQSISPAPLAELRAEPKA